MTDSFGRGQQNSAGELRICAGAEEVACAAADLFLASAAEAIAARGRFRVALSGGSTPRRSYELLALPARASQVEWDKVDIFWGDERYVAPDDPESNYHMSSEALLTHVPIPSANIHRVRTEAASPDAAATAYERAIRECFGEPMSLPRFDLIYLGLGTNGHTASLFPRSQALQEHTRLAVADFVAEVNMWRITMTAPLLNAGRTVAFLVSGGAKAEVLSEVVNGERDVERLPAQLIRPHEGRLVWIVDRAAARLLL